MTDPSEATHYQIELTSRQVLTGLAVLLTCVLAAFFAGVWIGRQAAADAAALELAAVDEVSRADQRFEFFERTTLPPDEERETERANPREGDDTARGDALHREMREEMDAGDDALSPAQERRAPEPAREDDRQEDDAVPSRSAAADPLPPPEDMGAARREESAADEIPPRRAGAGDTDDAAAPPAAPAAAAAPPGSTGTEGFHIQVLATSDRSKAEALVERLVDADFKAFLAPASEGGRTVYRVRIGPFPDRVLASRQAAELERRWGLESWISPSER